MKRTLFSTAILLVLTACGKAPEPAPPVIDIEAGKSIVQANCTGCHALEGRGKTAEIPNLAAQPVDYLVDAMHAYRDGVRHHAALQRLIRGFSEVDIANVAAYWSSLPPIKNAAPAASSAFHEGARVAEVCIDCHGEGGYSTTPGVPSLAGQQPAYLIVATQEYASGQRGHVEKEAMLSGLEQVDIEQMAMYFAAQTPGQRDLPPFGDPQAGEPLTAVCGGCHGARGFSEDPLVPNLAGQEPNYLVSAIKAYRDHKRTHEEMVTDKTDDQIEDIAAYYAVQVPAAAVEAYGELEEVIAKCDRCHGQIVGASSMVVPKLNGQQQDYLLRVMKEYRDGERGSTMMHKMSAGYSDDLLADLAAWYASHP